MATSRTIAEYKKIFSERTNNAREPILDKDGKNVRNNAILLSCLKDKQWRSFLRAEGHGLIRNGFLSLNDMIDLKSYGMALLTLESSCMRNFWVMKSGFYSSSMKTDELNGLCEDKSLGHIRYINLKDGKVYKKRAGRVLMSIIDDHHIGKHFPAQLKTYLCEQFALDWTAYAKSKFDNMELRLDLTFADIYGSGSYKCIGMGSCMTGRGYHSFYNDYVDATPVALVDEEKKEILARCVIFNEVRDDDTGETYRLAERQYAKDSDETLKKALVELLIAGGHIDGYKQVGAGCSESTAFVFNDGETMSCMKLSIRCSAHQGDTLSYQDSFKWLSEDDERACNYDDSYYDWMLDSTDGIVGDGNYDEYHGVYTSSELVTVYCNGNEMTCADDELEDFYWCDADHIYGHYNDVVQCENCGDYRLSKNAFYSHITGEDYCCEDCMLNAEQEYMKNNWFFAEYDNKYVEDEHDVVEIEKVVKGETKGVITMLRETWESFIIDLPNNFFSIDGNCYWRQSY